MKSDRRLVLDQSFDDVVDCVLAAFIGEGFSVRSLDGGDLRAPSASAGHRRYALLGVVLPELSWRGSALHADDSALLGCRLALFELTDSCTLLTAENPMMRYPGLAALVPRVNQRIATALGNVCRRSVTVDAA